MTYRVLARKSRPQTFAELVGQEAIVTGLQNGLRDGRIAQAYLFCGIRGVGKTTTARILAKALNCLGPDGDAEAPAEEPCNACVPCTEVANGANLDVLEVDAATYSTVDKIREITASLQYGPARDRYKVVVLDEVHRLGPGSFASLLKIVEEPPPRVAFVFATTEFNLVPATILSRCQEFHFRRVQPNRMVAHLRSVCENEGFEASDPALRLIARSSEGSVRDAVALLDQLATFGGGKLLDEDVGRFVGGVDAALMARLLAAILAGDGASVSGMVREVEGSGSDPRKVLAEFMGYLRTGLHLAHGASPEQMDLPEEAAQDLRQTARQAGYENLLRLLHLLLGSEATVRHTDAPGLALEVALLRAAELPRLVRLETLAAGFPAAPDPAGPQPGNTPRRSAGRAGRPAAPAGESTVRQQPAATDGQRPLAAGPGRRDPRPGAPGADPAPTNQGQRLREESRQGPPRGRAREPALEPARGNGSPSPGQQRSKTTARKRVAAAAAGTGAPTGQASPPPGPRSGPATDSTHPEPHRERPPARRRPPGGPNPVVEARRAAEEHPGVQAVLRTFGGHVLDVRPREPGNRKRYE